MVQGLTLATQGMTLMTQKQDQITNNLANMNTTGYKGSGLFVKSFEKYLANSQREPFANREIKADEVFVDYSEGPTIKTGNDLDCAVKGSGFFTVMTASGPRYSRNGNFQVAKDGFLVNGDGNKILGNDGFIKFDGKGEIRFNRDGEVLQGNESKGTLKIVDFPKPYKMLREGSSYFNPHPDSGKPVASSGYTIEQGFVEGSNVSPIRSMIEMIATYRTYESDQKALHAQDETLEKAVNVVGKM